MNMEAMAIRVVECSNGGTKLERFLPKNQHTQRKLLNFENWVNGDLLHNSGFFHPPSLFFSLVENLKPGAENL